MQCCFGVISQKECSLEKVMYGTANPPHFLKNGIAQSRSKWTLYEWRTLLPHKNTILTRTHHILVLVYDHMGLYYLEYF